MRRVLIFFLVMSLAGCSATPKPALLAPSTSVALVPATAPMPKPALPPLLLHLPGIGGSRPLDAGMIGGLRKGGYAGDVQIYDWCGTDAGLKALLGMTRNKQQAKIVADMLTTRFDADSKARTILTCHSGGAGIAAWALEDLPDRVKIDTLIFLAPALSPGYDLSKALSHVSGRAYVFSSVKDPVLGYGCRMLGTIDGVKISAAGFNGFTEPPGADAAEYAKLISIPYDPSWVYLDNFGDHIGAMTPLFSRMALAPLILSGKVPTSKPASE